MTAVVITKSDPFDNPTSGADYDEFLKGGYRGEDSLATPRPAFYDTTPLEVLAKVQPSLDLNFAQNKSLIDRVSGKNLITFTRASSGTYVGSDGLIKTATTNEPRFDHDPVTGESLGLLVEEQRTNLLLRSEEFQTTWSPSNMLAFGSGSITDATLAPNGTLTADRITENSANAQRFIVQTVAAIPASSLITASCYVKFDSPNRNFALAFTDAPSGGSGYAEAYLAQNGTLTTSTPTSFTDRTAAVQSVGNGWLRVSFTLRTANVTTITVRLYMVSTANSVVYQGDGTSGLFLWGAQLEAGAFPTSYIPTTATAVTRSADVASITGDNFSRWYRADEGSLFADWLSTGSNQFATVYNFNAGASNGNLIEAYRNNSEITIAARTRDSSFSSNVISNTSGGWLNVRHKLSHGVKQNAMASCLNGNTVGTLALANMPSPTQLFLGTSQTLGAANYLNGTIRRLTYFPQRLPNSTLQNITL